MNFLKIVFTCTFLVSVLNGCHVKEKEPQIVENSSALTKAYKPTWSSLSQHETPKWLKDAKFGIYSHITLETVQNIKRKE